MEHTVVQNQALHQPFMCWIVLDQENGKERLDVPFYSVFWPGSLPFRSMADFCCVRIGDSLYKKTHVADKIQGLQLALCRLIFYFFFPLLEVMKPAWKLLQPPFLCGAGNPLSPRVLAGLCSLSSSASRVELFWVNPLFSVSFNIYTVRLGIIHKKKK